VPRRSDKHPRDSAQGVIAGSDMHSKLWRIGDINRSRSVIYSEITLSEAGAYTLWEGV
jgi:hypothetical protein